MTPTQQSMMKVKIKTMRMTRMVLAMRPMRSPVSVMIRSIECQQWLAIRYSHCPPPERHIPPTEEHFGLM
jgi:hypothetical protein